MTDKIINRECAICGNVSGYDKDSLKKSTYLVNGYKIVLCVFCEDDLIKNFVKSGRIKQIQ